MAKLSLWINVKTSVFVEYYFHCFQDFVRPQNKVFYGAQCCVHTGRTYKPFHENYVQLKKRGQIYQCVNLNLHIDFKSAIGYPYFCTTFSCTSQGLSLWLYSPEEINYVQLGAIR